MSASTRMAIIDYGMGNLESVRNALAFLGYSPIISSDWGEIADASGYLLPGVGAFPLAMKHLQERNLVDMLHEQVMVRQKPILGICLGMHLMAKTSSELGVHAGLGWLNADVVQIPSGERIKVPHVGWSDIRIVKDDVLFKGFQPSTHFYFDHSYHLLCEGNQVAADCQYGTPIVAAVQQGNICATQFHPEKSQTAGLRLLRNFLNYVESRC